MFFVGKGVVCVCVFRLRGGGGSRCQEESKGEAKHQERKVWVAFWRRRFGARKGGLRIAASAM